MGNGTAQAAARRNYFRHSVVSPATGSLCACGRGPVSAACLAAQKLLLDKLAQLGYEDVRVRAFPVQFGAFDPERSNWYCVLARKKA